MRARYAILVAAVVAAMGLIGAWVVPAQSQPAAGARANSFAVSVFDRDGPLTRFVDAGARGFSVNDALYERHGAYDPNTGELIGDLVTHVNILRPLGKKGENALGILDCTVEAPNGDLTFYGAVRLSEFGPGVTLPVTGGTGDYWGARGTVTIKLGKLQGHSGAFVTFDITTP